MNKGLSWAQKAGNDIICAMEKNELLPHQCLFCLSNVSSTILHANKTTHEDMEAFFQSIRDTRQMLIERDERECND